ncbi:UDP-glycosyltransferase 83A1-like [Nymphaea colorata]|nr:UDP-glycosyltransferase 83A1-like [Nymphaea colorata]
MNSLVPSGSTMSSSTKPHVLAIPFPAQGHIMPLMQLSHRLIRRGFLVTFVNTEHIHERLMAAEQPGKPSSQDFAGEIKLVSIPDGCANGSDRKKFGTFSNIMLKEMPGPLENLILDTNIRDAQKITCVIADVHMFWALEVAEKLNITRVAFWPASAATFSVVASIPQLLEKRVIDSNGFLIEKRPVHLSDTMPAMDPAWFVWLNVGQENEKESFQFLLLCLQSIRSDHILCNSFPEIEFPAINLIKNVMPIGPLLSDMHLQPSKLWTEDTSCLDWLDRQPARSVIYVSFGSLTLLNQRQLLELAHGLELTGRPFLWVSRPDLMDGSPAVYPDGFAGTLAAGRGCVVEWAPQQEVLSHPSIACFLTHCGWNSTMEGLYHGLPLLCWSCFADQHLNEYFIVEVWKVGLRVSKGKDGIVRKEEMKDMLEKLLKDERIRMRAMEMKVRARKNVMEGGDSWKNFTTFVDLIS